MDEADQLPLTGESTATLTYKLQCIAVIFFSAIAGGLVPLRRSVSPKFLSLGNCFSGGIFLSAGFIHMLAEAMEGFEALQWKTSFPFVMFFTVLGILLPFFIERVILEQHDHTAFVSRSPRTLDSSGVVSGDTSPSSGMQANIYVLWLMLGVHSIIEGIALGVEKHKDDVTTILIAILSHKFFSAFALGISLVKANIPTRRTMQLVVSFSCSVPSGIVLGILMSNAVDGFMNSLLTEMMKAIAAGTFVYVALVEIILEEFNGQGGHGHHHDHDEEKGHKDVDTGDKYTKFGFVLLGVMMMSIFSVYHSHEH